MYLGLTGLTHVGDCASIMVNIEKNEISFAGIGFFSILFGYPGAFLEEKMNLKRFSIPFVLAFLTLWLASCTLSASTPPPPASPTNEGAMSTLQAELRIIATQTALARAATPGGIELPTVEVTMEPTSPPPTQQPSEVTEPTSQPTTVTVETPSAPKPTKETKKFEPPPIPDTYTMHSGEFPFCIARRFNVDQYELLNINGLSLNSRPDVGYVLKIPQTGDHFSGDRELRSHPDTYTVRSGDTIYSIACMYGDVYPKAIAQANNLKSPFDLTPGETIDIP